MKCHSGTTTTTKDDQIRIHLGANSRPISFEYYTENQGTQQTTSATYYYHYDLHGNVIRVTNSSGTTVIQYTYDQLGSIVSETNSSSIYNPFTYMGEAQVVHDPEFDPLYTQTPPPSTLTGLYSSGSGYYNPKTGTFLGGSGAPASANPTSTSAEEPTAQSTRPAGQLGAHAAIAAVGGGVPSTKTVASSIDVEPEPAATGGPEIIDAGPIQCSSGYVDLSLYAYPRGFNESEEDYQEREERARKNRARWAAAEEEAEKKRRLGDDVRGDLGKGLGQGHYPGDGHEGCGDPNPIIKDVDHGMYNVVGPNDYQKYYKKCMQSGKKPVPEDIYNALRNDGLTDNQIFNDLEFVAWGYLATGYTDQAGNQIEGGRNYLLGYKLKGQNTVLFWGPGSVSGASHNLRGQRYGTQDGFEGVPGSARNWVSSWVGQNSNEPMDIRFNCVNYTPFNISITINGLSAMQQSGAERRFAQADKFTFMIPVCGGPISNNVFSPTAVVYIGVAWQSKINNEETGESYWETDWHLGSIDGPIYRTGVTTGFMP